MKITSASNTIRLNKLSDSFIDLLLSIGFVEIPNVGSTYGIIDDTGNDVIIYDDNSGEFYRIKNGTLGDNGETACRYLNDKDGWELLLQDYPEVSVDYNINSLEDALGVVSY